MAVDQPNNCEDCGDSLASKRAKRCPGCNPVKNKRYIGKAMYVLGRMDEKPWVVEKFIRRGARCWKEDMYNMFDIVSINRKGKIRFIQVFDNSKTGGQNYIEHWRKMVDTDRGLLDRIIEGTNTFELWGFSGRLKSENKLYFLVHRFHDYSADELGSPDFEYDKLRILFNGKSRSIL